MEPSGFEPMPTTITSATSICPTCHQPVRPEYYFCPNCGTALHMPPLSTSIGAQIKLYVFSIILPMIGFLLVTRWQGVKYYKSDDPQARQIGVIAWTLLIISTVLTIWYAVVWTQHYIQTTVDGINADFSGQGF